MLKHTTILKLLTAVAALSATSASLRAQGSSGARAQEDKPKFDSVDAPDFKAKGWLIGRPAKDTPAEQFEHAAKLEAAGKLRSATRAYDALVSEWGASDIAKKAQLKVAQLYQKRGRPLDAFKEYQYFIEMFAGADEENFQTALARQFEIAAAESVKFDKGFWSSSDPGTTADMYRKIISNAPDWDKAPECQFRRGACYESSKKWVEAAFAYEALVTRYPDSSFKSDALYRAALSRVKMSDKFPRDERTMKNAILSLRLAYNNETGHASAAEAVEHHERLKKSLSKMNFEKAEFYDKIRNKPEAAIIAYKAFAKEFKDMPETKKALDRIEILQQNIPAANK